MAAAPRPALNAASAPASALDGGPARRRVVLGSALVLLGLALLGVMLFQRQAPLAELPYTYRPVAATPVEALQRLVELVPDGRIELAQLVANPTDQPVATLARLHRPGRTPALVEWRNALAEPVLYQDIDAAEELRLVEALRDHLPPGSTVYALPALSDRLAMLLDLDLPLAAAGDRATLRVPEPWLRAEAAIRASEAERNGRTGGEAADTAFAAFTAALLAEEAQGVARLTLMSGGREAFIILHLQDLFALGTAYPHDIAVGLHDFPAGGQVHDQARLVKSWISDNGHAAYAVLPRGKGVMRVLFLTEPSATGTLVAQLLPFNTARIGSTAGLRLVFQHRGYWVYSLGPLTATTED